MAIAGPTTNHTEIRRWANSNGAVPTEVLPHVVDSEPALLRLMLAEQAKDHANVRLISWEEFFVKFDALGLTLVYDDDQGGYNEILEVEEKSPYRHPIYRPSSIQN